jgi:hypothetical protein
MSGSNRSNDSYPPAASPACEWVRLALSEYVDGALPEPQAKEIQSHLEVCSPCLEVVAGFKRVQAVCEAAPELPETDFWSSISQTLQTDRQAHGAEASFSEASSCGFDPEFIFAYLDGEPVDSAEKADEALERFESHLFACTPCNEQIADADSLSMLLKDWHFRLEERLETVLEPFNLAEIVMAQYQQDALGADSSAVSEFGTDALALNKPCEVMTWETLSSFLDAELPDDEMLSVKNHLPVCQPCTRSMNAYQSVQTTYQYWSQRLETCAPDLTSQVMQVYQSQEATTEALQNKVLQGPAGWFNKKSNWLALPTIAAAMLLLVMATRSDFFTVRQSQESSRLAQSAASEEAPMAEMDLNATQSIDAAEAPMEASMKTSMKTSMEASTLSQNAQQTPLAAESFKDEALSKEEQGVYEGKASGSASVPASLPTRANRASGNVIAAAPSPGAPMSPFAAPAPKQASPTQAPMEMEADRQYAGASPAAARAADPSEKAAKAKKDQRELEALKQAATSNRDDKDKNDARLAFGGAAGKAPGQAPVRKQRTTEKIAYIPSAEEYLYAQHSRSIYSHEMSAMMGGEGSP